MLKRFISLTLTLTVLIGMYSVKAEEWTRISFATEEQRDRGMTGGEGCQWNQAIAISRSNPNFLMFGTDVSSVYRSVDGGERWEHADIGYLARGAAGGLVIDPFNENHIISVGANSSPDAENGLYTSFDGAKTWTHTYSAAISGYRDFRDQVAFDPSSYSKKSNMCLVAYWSRIDYESNQWGANINCVPSLYKTIDGGKTWKILDNSESYGGMFIKVNERGIVYVAGKTGFYKSTNGGVSFAKKADGVFTSMDVIYTRPNEVYLTQWNKILKSEDYGESFTELNITVAPEKLSVEPDAANAFKYLGWCELKVSPANPNNMVMCAAMGSYRWDKWYSSDGGRTWHMSVTDCTFSIIPYNNRQPKFVFHPTDPNVVFSFGGDWITKSDDGGKTYRFSNTGNNSVAGKTIRPNIYDGNLWFLPIVDYNSMASTDGGITWSYGKVQDEAWGGQTQGGYMVSDTYALAVANGKNGACLYECRNGAQNGVWAFEKVLVDNEQTGGELTLKSGAVYQSPTDPNILFAGQYVSRNCGDTWTEMQDCKAVNSYNRDPNGKKQIFGISTAGTGIVCSTDNGITWKEIVSSSSSISSFDYDWQHDAMYFISGSELKKASGVLSENKTETEIITSRLIRNSRGAVRVYSVAVDPVNCNIVYTAGSGDLFVNDTAVQRSVDGGKTWQVLTRNNRNSVIDHGPIGGVEGLILYVDPETEYLYVSTSCYGMWKIGPPGSVEDNLEPIAVTRKGDSIRVRWFGNGRMNVTDLAKVAYNSEYNQEINNATLAAFDKNGDREVNENDIEVLSYWLFKEWDNKKTLFELYKSTDGITFEKLLSATEKTEYIDNSVEKGKTYWYKVKNLTLNEFSKAVKYELK